jgi:hypothetical protein
MRVIGATERNGKRRVHEIRYLCQTSYDAEQQLLAGASAFCEAATDPRNVRYLMSSSHDLSRAY